MLHTPVKTYSSKKSIFYYNNKGYLAELKGDFAGAHQFYLRSADLADSIGDFETLALTYNNIGILYFNENDLEKALDHYLKAINLYMEKGLKRGKANCFNNIGNVYYTKKNNREAIRYYNMALDIQKKNQNENQIAQISNNIGSVYLQDNQLDSAEDHFKFAYEIQSRFDDKYGLAYSLLNLGIVSFKKNNYQLAEKFTTEGIDLGKKLAYPLILRDGYLSLYDICELKKDPAGSLKYYKLYIAYRDSILNQETLKQLNQMEMNNEMAKKESLLNAESNKQIVEKVQKEKSSTILTYSAILALIFIIIFSLLLLKHNKALGVQKKLLEAKNEELSNCVNLAKILQGTMLFPEDKLAAQFKDAFVFLKPKDVANRSLYCFAENNDHRFIALIDCPVRGIAGNFISLMGYETMHTILRSSINDPAETLKLFDNKMIELLKMSGHSSEKESDTALCAFSKKNNAVLFSGVSFPLIHISKGKLAEYKSADKYSTVSIQYTPGDMFYLFSERCINRSGEEKKNFSYDQLLNLFLSNADKPCVQQKYTLSDAFNAQRGGNDETDDVCIIGLRV